MPKQFQAGLMLEWCRALHGLISAKWGRAILGAIDKRWRIELTWSAVDKEQNPAAAGNMPQWCLVHVLAQVHTDDAPIESVLLTLRLI